MHALNKAVFLFALLPFTLTAQQNSTNQYFKELRNAQDLTDSIASLVVYRLNPPQDTAIYFESIRESLKKNHPEWYAAEKFSKLSKHQQALEAYEKIMAGNAKPSLKRYAKSLQNPLRSLIDPSLITPEPTSDPRGLNDRDYVLYKCNKIIEWSRLRERDSMLYVLKEMSEKVSEDIYPGFQVFCIQATLNNFFNQTPDEIVPLLDRGIRISSSIPEYRCRFILYNLQQAIAKRQSDYKGGLKAGQNASEMAKLSGNSGLLAMSYLNLAVYQQEQGRFEEAYKEIKKAREIYTKNNYTTGISQTYGSEAFGKMTEKKYDEAITLLKKAIQLELKMDKHPHGLYYLNLIESYYSLNRLDSVYFYYNKLVETDPDDKEGFQGLGKSFVAQYLVEKGDYQLAQDYISDTYTAAETYNDIAAKSKALLAHSKLFEAQGKYKKALAVFKEHMEIEQDFRNEDKAAEVTAARLNSEFDQEKKITQLNNEKEKIVISNQRNKAILLGFLGLLFAFSAILLFLFAKRKNKEIKEKNAKLQELNNVKDTLFQIIGHDLKKPSLTFRNISKNINYLIEKKDFKRLAALGEEVDQDAKSLYNLTDNLLNWALVQKDMVNIKKEKVNIHELVQENINLFQSFADRKQITLTNDTPNEVFTFIDKNSFHTIIRNLIDNAIKYTHEAGDISIFSKETEGMVQVMVTDNGIGMSHELKEFINHNTLIKSQKGTDGEKGSGIGLKLVKQLANRNQASLSIEKGIKSGSVFTLSIPLAS